MRFAIALPVIGVLCPPLPHAVQADLPVFFIRVESFAMIFGATLLLATCQAANCLLWPVLRWLKYLLAITAAADGRQGTALLRLSFSKPNPQRKN
jgi:hypothetical protein